MNRAIVFTRTKHGANKVAKRLSETGHMAEAIHGNKSQNARQAALDGFRSGRTRILVATDIAARGIDIDDITHVVNFELPDVPESYVHRIGRTARAGRGGIAIAFCDPSERDSLRAIEMLVKRDLTTMGGQPRPPHVKARARPHDAAGKNRHRQRRFKGGRDARRAA
jgi:ATP-dependent RNA helicase RhlE